jgi:spore coat protein JB
MLLKQITELDFMAVDLQLYLNTHPGDCNALNQYNATVCKARMLKQKYEMMYEPLYSWISTSKYPWQWTTELWPWHERFNFKFTGEGRY